MSDIGAGEYGLGGEGSSLRGLVMRRLPPSSCKGFTLFELVIVIIIIVVLAGMFAVRIPSYQEQAEKAAMQQIEGALQSALVLRFGALVSRNADTANEIRALAENNPINWLQKVPVNYAGELFDPEPGRAPPGSWVFDLKSREMIYFLNKSEFFKPGQDGSKSIRFHVRLVYEPALGRPKSGVELTSILFEPVETYHWLD